ncbi:MAG: 4Fe-4S binding protein [Planctomycetota bacterium]|jgi:ferredoxin
MPRPDPDLPLPVLAHGDAAPRSRMGRRRALALVLVHVLVAAHIVHGVVAGSTLTPLEPSEAGHSLRTGAVNAGAILLAVVILATLVLGRFFCGWACHLVAYQDAARWLLRRVGVRPAPVRSRLLLFVPLFAAWWLYGRPVVEPWLERRRTGDAAPGLSWHLTTDDFWQTFPGPTITVLTLLVCGALIVYVLGAKGFCTYGCPYGGLLAIADRFSPGRIRVNEDCDGTAACTANCTSNVDVAREVREFGMVVDPGCLKCLDCVSACPNDALRFGYRDVAGPRRRRRPSPLAWVATRETLVAVAGGVAVAAAFLADWRLGLAVAAGAAVALAAWLVARPPAPAAPGASEEGGDGAAPSFREDLLLAAAFVLCFAVLFDLHRAVPLLMAIGGGVIGAWLLLAGARLAYAPRVEVQRVVLKEGGLRRAGVVFAAGAVLVAAGLAHGALVQTRTRRAVDAFRVAQAARVGPDEAAAARAADTARAALDDLDRWAWLPVRGAGRMGGELERWAGRPDAALAAYARDRVFAKRSRELPMLEGLALYALGRSDEARGRFRESVRLGTAPRDRFLKLNWELRRLGDEAARAEMLAEGVRRFPADAEMAMELCTLLARSRDPAVRDEGSARRIAAGVAAADGRRDPELLGLLAWLHARAGDPAAAVRAAEDSVAAARAAGRDDLAADMARMADAYRAAMPGGNGEITPK